MSILNDLQEFVSSRLNSEQSLSAISFIEENSKTVDYQIKQAIGKQGIVGIVMTPKATFIGKLGDESLAWQIDELEIDIVENPTVNRGRAGSITGQDAAMKVFGVLCPTSGDDEGQFNPVSYEQGEDGGLLVNKAVLRCALYK